ncbi:hypothetical protein CYANOKiyG1_58880 [Okeania sp. KiyG1]|nr:hypothetical protein CYANOKiyG1_58880 [Okeania sp. KiyG1]
MTASSPFFKLITVILVPTSNPKNLKGCSATQILQSIFLSIANYEKGNKEQGTGKHHNKEEKKVEFLDFMGKYFLRNALAFSY